MEREIWEELEEIGEKEKERYLLEGISEEEAEKIFDKYSSMYDEALRRLS